MVRDRVYIKEELFKRQALFAALSLSLCLSKEAAAAAKKKQEIDGYV